MDTTHHEIEVFLMIDRDGDYVVARDPDELGDMWDSEVRGPAPAITRVYSLKLKGPTPRETTITATLPETDAPVTVTVSE